MEDFLLGHLTAEAFSAHFLPKHYFTTTMPGPITLCSYLYVPIIGLQDEMLFIKANYLLCTYYKNVSFTVLFSSVDFNN